MSEQIRALKDECHAQQVRVKELESKCAAIQKLADDDGFEYADKLQQVEAQRDELLEASKNLFSTLKQSGATGMPISLAYDKLASAINKIEVEKANDN